MASATDDDEKTMSTDELPGDAEEPRESKGPRPPAVKEGPSTTGGFFTVYKKGQGYWTRICTAVTAGFLILVTTHFLWQQMPPQIRDFFIPENATNAQVTAGDARARSVAFALCTLWVILAPLFTWKVMNKAGNVDFLIATDSEMKKVNWTSKKELIGSTKVVIMFMILLAVLLFMLDMYFIRVFYQLGVLVSDSPLWVFASSVFGWFGARVLDLLMGGMIFGGAFWAVYGTAKGK
jgi:preprotein translocase SecE subunit